MKKRTKRILLGIAVVFILLIGIGLYFCYPMLSMSPAKTGQVSGTEIFAVRNQMGAVYFINTDSGSIMFDAGSNLKKLDKTLKAENINAGDVKWVFLTHSDYDHVAGLPLFPNAVIHMNEDELPLVNGTVKRSASGGNSLPSGIDANKIVLLREGQEITCGGTRVRCIKAPGHTNGSMVYLVNGTYLFTGDAFAISKGSIGIHPFTMNAELVRKSTEQLKETINNSSVILTSHYGYHRNISF